MYSANKDKLLVVSICQKYPRPRLNKRPISIRVNGYNYNANYKYYFLYT